MSPDAALTVTKRNTDGEEEGTVELDPAIFGVEPNVAVMHQVVTAQLAKARAGTHSTLTRAEARGGGAKPYRQKGTGRARQGSTRSPQWVGGGKALGPKPRDYSQRTPKKMVQLALRCALSDRAAEGRVVVVPEWPMATPRTKDAVTALATLGLEGKVLVVLGQDDGVAARSFANLPQVQLVLEGELNTYDVLRNDWVVFTDETLPGNSVQVAPKVGEEAAPADARPSDERATIGADASSGPAGETARDEVADGAGVEEEEER
jgi:large subunit ribosomal protein L4